MATGLAKARILVVDDHPMVRGGLIRLINQQIDMVCCGEAGTPAEAQVAVADLKPDLAIVDLRLNGSDGLELIGALKLQFAGLRVLVLSQYGGSMYVQRALHAGALGYVVKEQGAEELLTAIRTVLNGEIYLTRSMAARLLQTFVGPSLGTRRCSVERLTNRELHVLQLLGSGMGSRKIATQLNLSLKTIETHRENIKHKLGLRDAAELVLYANEWAREQVSLPQQLVTDSLQGLDG
jgi:DNA-binding NarL/FixJ family response regulator